MRGTAKPHTASRRNVKKQNAVSGPYATATLTDEHDDTRDQPFYEIVPDGFSIPSLDVLERKELLSLLAQRIAQLPLASKKLLAMYYYENLESSRSPRGRL